MSEMGTQNDGAGTLSEEPQQKTCPFLGEACIEDGCALWIESRRQDPRLGTVVTFYQCALKAQPIFMIQSPQQHSGGFPHLGGRG